MSKTKIKTRKQLIGYCGVDSGQILITDPSYLSDFGSEQFGDRVPDGHYSYAGACQRTLADDFNGQLTYPAGHAGIGVVSRTGLGDGYYPVYATIADLDDWGERVVKIEIEFVDLEHWFDND